MYIRQREPAKIVSKEWKLTIVFLRGLNVVSPDGNGRVGRTLLNYWLMINNYPPTIVYEEACRAYYDALQAYDEQEDLTPLVQFLEAQTVKTWSRSTEGKKPTPHKKLNSFLL